MSLAGWKWCAVVYNTNTSTSRTDVCSNLDRLLLSTRPQKRIVSPGTYPDFGSQAIAVMGPD